MRRGVSRESVDGSCLAEVPGRKHASVLFASERGVGKRDWTAREITPRERRRSRACRAIPGNLVICAWCSLEDLFASIQARVFSTSRPGGLSSPESFGPLIYWSVDVLIRRLLRISLLAASDVGGMIADFVFHLG